MATGKPGNAIYGKLTGTAAVAAIIGNRVYPLLALQLARFPLVGYQVDDSQHDRHYDGRSGLERHELTIACLALTYDACETLGSLVAATLDNQDSGVSTWGGQTVDSCFVEDVGEALEADVGIERRVFRKDLQVTLWLYAAPS